MMTFEMARGDKRFVIAGCALLGLALGWFAPTLAGWMQSVPWLPFQGLIEAIADLSGVAGRWLPAAVLAAAGLIAGALLVESAPRVEISERAIVVREGSKRSRLARSQVAELAIEEKRLVARDHDDVELLRTAFEGKGEQILAGARRYGWPTARTR